MKHLFITLTFAALSLASQEVLATGLAQKSPGDPACDQAVLQEQFGGINMSANEFSALTPKEIAKKTGKKMSWGKRILFKIAQKRIKKQMEKNDAFAAEGKAAGGSKMGVISLILCGAGVLLTLLIFINIESTFLAILFLLGSACVLTGLVFGIIGLIKDQKKVAAIIGTALSAVVIWWLVVFIATLDKYE